MELAGKTIIATGASSDIGAAAAVRFAAEGAAVVLGARHGAALDAVAARIARAGGRAATLPGDVRDPAFAAGLVEFALARFGGLDGAFNNAGIVGAVGPVPAMTAATGDEVLGTNLSGAFLAARAQLPVLIAQRRGALVFTGSFVGVSNGGLPGMAAYAASKAGLLGLVRALAAAHAADGVRINALLPGGTVTPAGGEGNPDILAFVAGLHPMKRMAAPDEIAQAAVFLLSDRASVVTAAPLLADGGISVRLA